MNSKKIQIIEKLSRFKNYRDLKIIENYKCFWNSWIIIVVLFINILN